MHACVYVCVFDIFVCVCLGGHIITFFKKKMKKNSKLLYADACKESAQLIFHFSVVKSIVSTASLGCLV